VKPNDMLANVWASPAVFKADGPNDVGACNRNRNRDSKICWGKLLLWRRVIHIHDDAFLLSAFPRS